ncbi:MAG: hypothetical protein LQ348_004539 [Seirophora lacunosa]|nr:MAG: hypothetical protein LQ348_004539 [Seirophora lacunosa]
MIGPSFENPRPARRPNSSSQAAAHAIPKAVVTQSMAKLKDYFAICTPESIHAARIAISSEEERLERIGYDLLKQGYRVRGTTRTVESAEALLKGAYSPFAHRVEIVQVPDITPEGAFDEAVKFHTASPISYALTSWSSTVDVAVAGAISILDSAVRHAGPRLSSFVFTSSFAACTDPQAPLPKTFTENDWNTWAEAEAKSKEFEELDDLAKGLVLYQTSKTAAERAVWQWREEKKVTRDTGAEVF